MAGFWRTLLSGDDEPERPTGRSAGADLPEGTWSDGAHPMVVMNADGTQSSTKTSCRCSIGTEHDGPIPKSRW
jgi:hypothetical protein